MLGTFLKLKVQIYLIMQGMIIQLHNKGSFNGRIYYLEKSCSRGILCWFWFFWIFWVFWAFSILRFFASFTFSFSFSSFTFSSLATFTFPVLWRWTHRVR